MVRKFFAVIRTLGVSWVLFRIKYALKMRLGWFERRLPCRSWDLIPAEEIFNRRVFPGSFNAYRTWKTTNLRRFLFSEEDFCRWKSFFDAWGSKGIDEELGNLWRGRFRYFENEYAEAGFPPCWNRNPFSGECATQDKHWSRLSDFGFGDIKLIWEASRFGWVFPLVRKYARTREEVCARTFWELFEDWCEKNPPETGANWKCGQEVSLRLMAWLFAFYAFEKSPETTESRVSLFVRAIYESARRVFENLDYALSQKNNHGVSECVGLIAAGVLFPELRGSARWLAVGLENLKKQIEELVYPDGGFSQHSLNYHRVMMQDLAFALRIMDLNGLAYPAILRERLVKATEYARDFVFGNDGDTPCWGANDGAHVFRLSECKYRDFRPHLQAAGVGFSGVRYFPAGHWDEEALWFFGKEALENAQKEAARRARFSAKTAGTHVIRRGDIAVFLRCGAFVHRPGDNDLLHLDIWKDGVCIVGDTGSFSYNSRIPFVRSHNTVTVDNLPQMQQLSRFLKIPARGALVAEEEFEFFGMHSGYERLAGPVVHLRRVCLGESGVCIEDALSASVAHEYTLTWVFPLVRIERKGALRFEFSDELGKIGTLSVHAGSAEVLGITVHEGNTETGEGFVSPYYNTRVPARILEIKVRGSEVTLHSEFSF